MAEKKPSTALSHESIAGELTGRPRERLLALAAIFDGATRVEAAKIACVGNEFSIAA
jgi:hypothetical protein